MCGNCCTFWKLWNETYNLITYYNNKLLCGCLSDCQKNKIKNIIAMLETKKGKFEKALEDLNCPGWMKAAVTETKAGGK